MKKISEKQKFVDQNRIKNWKMENDSTRPLTLTLESDNILTKRKENRKL